MYTLHLPQKLIQIVRVWTQTNTHLKYLKLNVSELPRMSDVKFLPTISLYCLKSQNIFIQFAQNQVFKYSNRRKAAGA